MNHGYIIENNIVDLYLTGNLSTEECEQFELHYVDCQSCLGLLEMSRSFKHGLQLLNDDPVWSEGRARAVGPFGWLAQFNRSRQVAILAFALALLLVPVTLLAIRVVLLQGELSRMKSSIPRGEESAGDQAGSDGGAAKADEQPSVVSGNQAAAKIVNQSKERQGESAAVRPQINTPIFVLSSEREAATKRAMPVNEFVVPQGSRSFIFSVELEGEPEYKTYQVGVSVRDGRTVWQASNLIPDEHKSLVIVFTSDFFREGAYKLKLNGVRQDGALQPVNDYDFRIIKKKLP